MHALTAEWVEKAEGDFATVGREVRARTQPNYDAACFGLPNFVAPRFDARAIALIARVALVLVAENTGHVKAVEAMTRRPLRGALGRRRTPGRAYTNGYMNRAVGVRDRSSVMTAATRDPTASSLAQPPLARAEPTRPARFSSSYSRSVMNSLTSLS